MMTDVRRDKVVGLIAVAIAFATVLIAIPWNADEKHRAPIEIAPSPELPLENS
jgi:hypothetical protein